MNRLPRIALAVALVSAVLGSSSSPAAAAPGDFDTTYGTAGIATVAASAAPEAAALAGPVRAASGKLLLFGSVSRPDGSTDAVLVQLNADGTVDTGFDGDGVLELGTTTQTAVAAYQSDGSIIAGITPDSGPTSAIKISPAGVVDATWGSTYAGLPGGGRIGAIAVDATDNAVVFGADGADELKGARLAAADGGVVESFTSTEMAGTFQTLVLLSDGSPVTVAAARITFWQASVTSALPGGLLLSSRHSVDRDPTDRVYVAGASAIARYDGTVLDPTFGTDGVASISNAVHSVVVDTDGTVFVVRVVLTFPPPAPGRLAYMVSRLTATGAIDTGGGVEMAPPITVSTGARFYLHATRGALGELLLGDMPSGGRGSYVVTRVLTSPGSVDTSFASNGYRRVSIGGTRTVNRPAVRSVTLGDGSTIVLTARDADLLGVRLVKLTPAGVLDTSFGSGGTATSDLELAPVELHVAPNGQIYVIATMSYDVSGVGVHKNALVRFSAAGVIDSAFATTGMFTTSDETLFAVNTYGDKIQVVATSALYQLLSSGAPDPAFGTGGRLAIPAEVGAFGDFDGPKFLPDGSFVARVFGTAYWKFSAAGIRDTSFQISALGSNVDINVGFIFDNVGRIVSTGVGGPPNPLLVGRYSPSGVQDTSFGTNGITDLGPAPFGFSALSVDAADRIVAATPRRPAGPRIGVTVFQLTERGALDTTFDGDGRKDIDYDQFAVVASAFRAGSIFVAGSASAPMNHDIVVMKLQTSPSPDKPYRSLTPSRIIDTRIPIGVAQAAPVQPGGTLEFMALGKGGVPTSGVDAVVLNLTAANARAAGYLTVWPTGSPRPTASSLNFGPGRATANSVIAKLGPGGSFNIRNSNDSPSEQLVDVIADVVGWFPAGGSYNALVPDRTLDTRLGRGAPRARVAAGGEVSLVALNVGGVPATGVSAVALNLTVASPRASGYITVWPGGAARPNASSLNFGAGETTANLVLATVGAGGVVKLWNSNDSATMSDVDLIADVVGWYAAGGGYRALTPDRVLDTRTGNGAPAIMVGAGGSIDVTVAGRGGVPATGIDAVVLNVTATSGSATGYITVWPTGSARPRASSLNFAGGQTVANLVIAKVGTDGKISLWNANDSSAMRPVNLIADVVGWFPTAT